MPSFKNYCDVFFWDFKRRDNAVYNFDILCALINSANECPKNRHLYYKPILIQIMAIIECTIYDLLLHIKEERQEGINLTANEKKPLEVNQYRNLSKNTLIYVKNTNF